MNAAPPPHPFAARAAVHWRAGLRYGLLGLPLAFAALPMYVVLPHRYAQQHGLALASIGVLLMVVRLCDALVEPLLGRWCDQLYARSLHTVLGIAGGAAALLALGLTALYFPLPTDQRGLWVWMFAGLAVTSVAHSQLTLAHQAWGVRLGGDAVQRSRIVAWREGHALVGVVAASALALTWGPAGMLGVFGLALAGGYLLWWQAPRPAPLGGAPAAPAAPRASVWRPLHDARMRRLLLVFLCNGTASAIPAALMLFFAQDVLRAREGEVALFLALYFVCAALGLPLWLRLVGRWGLARSWLAAMLLAVACFGWTAALGAGQTLSFAVVCALTGVAFGADLALPSAMLAGLVARAGAVGRTEGAYLGWWSLTTKFNLALAAGGALPLLQWWGYTPGSTEALALQPLRWTYALLPCALKLLAAALLYLLCIRPTPAPPATPRKELCHELTPYRAARRPGRRAAAARLRQPAAQGLRPGAPRARA